MLVALDDPAHVSGTLASLAPTPVPPQAGLDPLLVCCSPLTYFPTAFHCSSCSMRPREQGGCSDGPFMPLSSQEILSPESGGVFAVHLSLYIDVFIWLFPPELYLEDLNLAFRECHKPENSVRPAEKEMERETL